MKMRISKKATGRTLSNSDSTDNGITSEGNEKQIPFRFG